MWRFELGHQLPQPLNALSRHDSKLAERRPQRVGYHGALPHQQRAGGVNSHRRLLLYALHRHRPHRRTADRLADRLRVPAVVLVALHIRLHIGRRHQPDLVAITADHPSPVVRTATGLNAHRAGRQLCKELLHGAAPKLTPQHNTSRCINPVNLEHVLRQIQTNYANLAHGRLPCLVESHHQSGTLMPSGAVHPIIARSQRVPPWAGPMINSATKQSTLRFFWLWIASRSLSSGARSRDPFARNDGGIAMQSAFNDTFP